MRIFVFIVLLTTFTRLSAQSDTVIVFYDREGKLCQENDATKFALQVKEDDHYKKLTVDMRDKKVESIVYFSDSECKNFDGPYKGLYKNGRTRTTGYYSGNKKISTWKTWSDDGILTDSIFYVDGFISGIALSWNKQGVVIDSLIFESDGNGVGRGYWNNGNPSERGAYRAGKKDGMWTYYYDTGKKCQEVNYLADSAISYTCYDQNGGVQTGNCFYEKEAAFPGGDEKWVQYLNSELSTARLPKDYYSGKTYGEVWIQFVVDVDGSITGLQILQSAGSSLDEIVLGIFKNSPKWQNAVQYNRPVKAYRRQPITFSKVTN